MSLKLTALAILIASAGVCPLALAASAAPPAPDVIAPGDLPALHPLLSDSAPALARGTLQAAPMPDQDLSAPAVGDKTTQVRPTLYVQKDHYAGDGYEPGSDDHERPIQPAAGVAVDVPIN